MKIKWLQSAIGRKKDQVESIGDETQALAFVRCGVAECVDKKDAKRIRDMLDKEDKGAPAVAPTQKGVSLSTENSPTEVR